VSKSLDLRTVVPGDIIEQVWTYEVLDVYGSDAHRVVVKDVARSGYVTSLSAVVNGSRYRMVKRAVRPAPKAGDILTGQQIQDRQWKRGTVIQCQNGANSPSPLFLQSDGFWVDEDGESYAFDDLNPDANFKLLHVA